MIAAGGLNTSNLSRIVTLTNAWGVDVSSGVEESPGKKNPAKVSDFVNKANKVFVQPEDSNE